VYPKAENDTKVYLFHSALYNSEALQLLAYNFPGIIKFFIARIFESNNENFTDSFMYLKRIYSEQTWLKWLSPMIALKSFCVKLRAPVNIVDMNLYSDVASVNHCLKMELSASDMKIARLLNYEEYSRNNQLIECQCCSNLTVGEDLACCQSGHLICHECCSNYMKESIYGRYESLDVSIPCLAAFGSFDNGDRCTSKIDSKYLSRIDLFDRYYESIRERNISRIAVNFPGLIVRCRNPVCGDQFFTDHEVCHRNGTPTKNFVLIFFVVMASFLLLRTDLAVIIIAIFIFNYKFSRVSYSWSSPFFTCPTCNKKTCRKCANVFYSIHDCNDTGQVAPRILIEKAMTDAIVRVCPKCNVCYIFIHLWASKHEKGNDGEVRGLQQIDL
jgi:hypothetical protein